MIQSHTAHGIYNLKVEVPETMYTGQIRNIPDLSEFEWYFWVMFRNTAVSFPKSPWVLSWYCVPSGVVVPKMDADLLKSNGRKVV